jgi:predicted ATPase
MDSKALGHGLLASTLFLMGHPDQAMSHARAGVAWGQTTGHAHTQGGLLFGLACMYHYRGEKQQVLETTEALRELASRHPLPLNMAYGELLRGWAERDLGRCEEALALVVSAGQSASLSYWGSLVAEVEAELGRAEPALNRLDESIRRAAQTGSSHYLPELHRRRGELLLTASGGDVDAAAAAFHEALDVARSQQEKMLELRAAVSLGRLLVREGRNDEARSLLAPLCDWFAEGAETFDIQTARGLLARLGDVK